MCSTTLLTKGAVDGAVSDQKEGMRPGRGCDLTGSVQLGHLVPLGGKKAERRQTVILNSYFNAFY